MTQKNEIIEWVGRGNMNPAVLGSMIDGLESGSGTAIGNIINIDNQASESADIYAPTFCMVFDDAMVPDRVIGPGDSISGNIISVSTKKGFEINFIFLSETDNMNVTVNGTLVEFISENGYSYTSVSSTPITGQTYNVVITDKEGQK